MDGAVLQRVREVVGPLCIVIAVNDQHSNITERMVAAADALFIERTYPHDDMHERAVAAVSMLGKTSLGRKSHSDATLCISLVILHTKHTGRRQNDFNVHA